MGWKIQGDLSNALKAKAIAIAKAMLVQLRVRYKKGKRIVKRQFSIPDEFGLEVTLNPSGHPEVLIRSLSAVVVDSRFLKILARQSVRIHLRDFYLLSGGEAIPSVVTTAISSGAVSGIEPDVFGPSSVLSSAEYARRVDAILSRQINALSVDHFFSTLSLPYDLVVNKETLSTAIYDPFTYYFEGAGPNTLYTPEYKDIKTNELVSYDPINDVGIFTTTMLDEVDSNYKRPYYIVVVIEDFLSVFPQDDYLDTDFRMNLDRVVKGATQSVSPANSGRTFEVPIPADDGPELPLHPYSTYFHQGTRQVNLDQSDGDFIDNYFGRTTRITDGIDHGDGTISGTLKFVIVDNDSPISALPVQWVSSASVFDLRTNLSISGSGENEPGYHLDYVTNPYLRTLDQSVGGPSFDAVKAAAYDDAIIFFGYDNKIRLAYTALTLPSGSAIRSNYVVDSEDLAVLEYSTATHAFSKTATIGFHDSPYVTNPDPTMPAMTVVTTAGTFSVRFWNESDSTSRIYLDDVEIYAGDVYATFNPREKAINYSFKAAGVGWTDLPTTDPDAYALDVWNNHAHSALFTSESDAFASELLGDNDFANKRSFPTATLPHPSGGISLYYPKAVESLDGVCIAYKASTASAFITAYETWVLDNSNSNRTSLEATYIILVNNFAPRSLIENALYEVLQEVPNSGYSFFMLPPALDDVAPTSAPIVSQNAEVTVVADGSDKNINLSASGGGPIVWFMVSNLPANFYLNPTAGLIRGKTLGSEDIGTTVIRVKAANASGVSSTMSFTLNVVAA